MTKFTRLAVDAISLLALPLFVGFMGVRALEQRNHPSAPPTMAPAAVDAIPRPALDTTKQTVVVLLGSDLTEITDALGPYEMFARAGMYNVVTAAAQRQPAWLTGGLMILPHYSLAEIDRLLDGPPAVVVVPNLPNAADALNRPVIDWIKKQANAGSMIHSWCKGAMALAETGLLDGQTATAHWGDIPKLEKSYPKVTWVRGVRWIDRGQFVMSAGITSGIDASLRVLIRLSGDSVARRVAAELRYPNYHYAIDPSVEQYELRLADAILYANAAFHLNRPTVGLALYPGVGEIDLSNVFDAHAHLMTATVVAVAADTGVVTTEHGLTVFPGASGVDLDRLIIPGTEGRSKAAAITTAIRKAKADMPLSYVHAEEPGRFGLEPVIEDLARSSDALTAQFALRRMEYRSGEVAFGNGRPWTVFVTMLALSAIGLIVNRLLVRIPTPLHSAPARRGSPGRHAAHATTSSNI
jgi:transcriptional regulator GlxA family with amidase domain